jgi:uncharacterized protein YbjT (DUF2867 family)
MRTEGRPAVVVAGATGRLGSLVGVLLERGHHVRALTRDPRGEVAAGLRHQGAEVAYGDFDDPDSIETAARGFDVVFGTGTAHRAGPDGELRHGLNLADATAAAGVEHLIYSSGDGAAADSPVPLFRAKHAVEQHIRSLPLGATILAPVYFMENLFNPWNLEPLRNGTLPSPIAVERPLQQLAVADLIAFAAVVLQRPGDFAGERVRLASDELSAERAAALLSRAGGREFRPVRAPREVLPPALAALFSWLEDEGHSVDRAELKARYPEVGWHDYEAWIDSQRQRFREICPHDAVPV